MKVNVRTLLFTLLGLALAGLFAAWLVSATEWDTRDVWEPPKGEAARDPHFLLKRLVTRLGAQVEVRHQLNQLPPEGGTLLLETANWRFMPEREAELRAWVERGGHLVVYQAVADTISASDDSPGWVPVTMQRFKRRPASGATSETPSSGASGASSPDGTQDEQQGDEEDWGDEEEEDEDEAPVQGTAASSPAATPSTHPSSGSSPSPHTDGERKRTECTGLAEPAEHPGWFGAPRQYKSCALSVMVMKTKLQPMWSVADDKGLRAARVPLGRGTVTLSTQWTSPGGATLQDEEDALLTAAILQLRTGQHIWIIDDTRHPGLFATLWRVAPAACALSVLALLLVLWRWSIRFAPLRAPDTLARRSITSQVRGTAAYLLRHGPAALHRAQLRALEEAALAHVPGWRRLSAERRAAVLARHAELPPAELEQACNPDTPGDPRAVGRALGLMEAARRRIAELGQRSNQPVAPPPSSPPSSPTSPPSSPPSARDSRKTRP